MKEYDVEITETLQRTVKIKANSQCEAEEKAADAWAHGDYVLDAEDFVGADFKAISARSLDHSPKRHDIEH